MEEKKRPVRDASKTALVVIAVILVFATLKIAYVVTLPLVIALFLFLFFNPLLNRLEKLKVPRWLGVTIVMVLLLVTLTVAVWFFFFTIDRLIQRLPMYIRRFVVIDAWIAEKIGLDSGPLCTSKRGRYGKALVSSLAPHWSTSLSSSSCWNANLRYPNSKWQSPAGRGCALQSSLSGLIT